MPSMKRSGPAVRLVSQAYRKSGTRGKREHQHSSIVPFVSAAGEVISVFYVLASKPGEKLVSVPHFKSLRDHTSYREYFLITPTGYTNNEVFPAMVAQFEEDFHRLYPGVRALVYLDRLGSHTTQTAPGNHRGQDGVPSALSRRHHPIPPTT